VWFGIVGGRLYFRSLADAVKLRRIARDERVLVAPCSARGRPTGPPFEGRARILDDEAEAADAERAIQSNYGTVRRAYERAIRDAPARYVEVVPA
jgi:PPOX class probable F420-dependent enzyme